MKKIYLSLILSSSLAYSASLDSIIDNIGNSLFNKLDKQFNGLLNSSSTMIDQCFDLGNFSLDKAGKHDVCEIADAVEKLDVNVCSLVGGSGNKTIRPTGARALCEAKTREFSDYSSKMVSDFAEYSLLNSNVNDLSAKLPSGQSVNEYFRDYDVRNLLSSDNSVIASYLKNGNMQAVEVMMDYAKSAQGGSPNSIKAEDIKAPTNLESYNKNLTDSVKQYKEVMQSASPSSIANSVKASISSSTSGDNSKTASDYVAQKQDVFEVAKQAEISSALASSNYKKIAIPTDEYVQTLRPDLRPQVVAQIRKQQAYEVETIAKIEEKWARKYEMAKLLADKEVVMAQKFDEASAKNEIEKIANSATSNNNNGI